MKSAAREIGFALLAWLVPFAISVALFPLKGSQPPLFESLIAVVLAASTVMLGCLYLRRAHGRPLAQGIKIGLVWTIANWLLDGLMFSGGPMKMSFAEYAADI